MSMNARRGTIKYAVRASCYIVCFKKKRDFWLISTIIKNRDNTAWNEDKFELL